MKTILLCLALSGCATMPEEGHFSFACKDGVLMVGLFFLDNPAMYAANIGRCLGDLMIVGQTKGAGT